MIWLGADLHLNHDKDFIYEKRGFKNVSDMNYTILKNFNHVINYNDDLYLLGDNFLGDLDAGIKLFKQLPGNIHLIWGNHDTDNRKEALANCYNVVEVCGYSTILKYNDYHFYLSHYPTLTTNFDDNSKPLKKRLLCISGHTHSTSHFEPCGAYNVAVDAHNCYPVSIDEVVEAFKLRNQ